MNYDNQQKSKVLLGDKPVNAIKYVLTVEQLELPKHVKEGNIKACYNFSKLRFI